MVALLVELELSRIWSRRPAGCHGSCLADTHVGWRKEPGSNFRAWHHGLDETQ